MASTVRVGLARIPDQQELLRTLAERGVEARAVGEGDELAVEIPCDGDASRLCDELLADLEAWVAETGLPLVPVHVDGSVFLRPPAQ